MAILGHQMTVAPPRSFSVWPQPLNAIRKPSLRTISYRPCKLLGSTITTVVLGCAVGYMMSAAILGREVEAWTCLHRCNSHDKCHC